MKNPTLRPLIGGVHAVTLSASEAKRRNPEGEIHKTQLERAGAPTFEVVVELVSKNRCRIYRNIGKVVDDLLLGHALVVEERWQVLLPLMFTVLMRKRPGERSSLCPILHDQAAGRLGRTQESSSKPPSENWFEELQQQLGPGRGEP